MQPALNKLTKIALFFAAIGFVDATYLTIKWYSGGALPCALFKSCDLVTRSSYSDIAGVPISLLGALYYLGMTLLLIYVLDRARPEARRMATLRITAWGTLIGLITSLILLFIQAFILEAYCLYCIISAASSIALFATGVCILRSLRRANAVVQ